MGFNCKVIGKCMILFFLDKNPPFMFWPRIIPENFVYLIMIILLNTVDKNMLNSSLIGTILPALLTLYIHCLGHLALKWNSSMDRVREREKGHLLRFRGKVVFL